MPAKTKEYPFEKLSDLTEETAREYACEIETIKGCTVYYLYLTLGYSFSAVVFMNGHRLPYVHTYGADFGRNLYRSKLRERIRSRLQNTLFTLDEIKQPLSSYIEYRNKREYLINHYPCQLDHVSAFHISRGAEDDAAYARSIEGKIYDPVCFAYFDDEAFVHEHIALHHVLRIRLLEKADDYDFYYEAFKFEMYNVEYAINPYQGNYDAISAFGKVEYDYVNQDENLEYYFNQLKFTDAQRRAYRAARSFVLNHSGY